MWHLPLPCSATVASPTAARRSPAGTSPTTAAAGKENRGCSGGSASDGRGSGGAPASLARLHPHQHPHHHHQEQHQQRSPPRQHLRAVQPASPPPATPALLVGSHHALLTALRAPGASALHGGAASATAPAFAGQEATGMDVDGGEQQQEEAPTPTYRTYQLFGPSPMGAFAAGEAGAVEMIARGSC